jgi:hypothetical protein
MTSQDDEDWYESEPSNEIEDYYEKSKSFPGKGFLQGLGQSAEDYVTSKGQGINPDVEFPEHWKPEKIRKENMPEMYRPSLGIEEEVDPEQGTQFNVGRYAPLLLGMLMGGGSTALSAKNLTNKAVGNEIATLGKQTEKHLKNRYENVLTNIDELEKAQNVAKQKKALETKKVPTAEINRPWKRHDKPEPKNQTGTRVLKGSNLETFKKHGDPEYFAPIDKFIKDPSVKNTHFAKSAIKDLNREMAFKKKSPSGLTPEEKQLYAASRSMEKYIQKYMDRRLKKIGPNAHTMYTDLTKDYAKGMNVYNLSPDLRAAMREPGQKGFRKPFRLPKKLSHESNDPVRRQLEKMHPNLKWNRIFASPIRQTILNRILGNQPEAG